MNGILCISSKNNISLDTYLNYLDYIQHRGKRSFGYLNDSMIHIDGLIKNYKQYDNYTSPLFLGYTTKYSNNIDTRIECKFGLIDIIIDGEEKYYKIFERVVNAKDNETIEEGLIEFIKNNDMAYSIILHINNIIYVMRDKYGFKPLMYTINKYGFHVSSEINGYFKYVNIIDVKPGSILKIDKLTLSTIYSESATKKHCLYEYIDIMNSKTLSNNIDVSIMRDSFIETLAKTEEQTILDTKFRFIVVGIPNSNVNIAMKYASYLNIRYEPIILKENSFTLNDTVLNKNIILVSKSENKELNTIVNKFNEHGVNELHVRIASPKIYYHCNNGIENDVSTEINNYTTIKYINLSDIHNDNMCIQCI